jgi:GNAT superfamily N-acetyltransferase
VPPGDVGSIHRRMRWISAGILDPMTIDRQLSVRRLEPRVGQDPALVDELTELINGVYATAESGLWRDRATRTTATELAELIRAGQIVVATRDGRIVGSVRIHDVADDTCEFGLLVSAPDQRGSGVGRTLLDFVEAGGRERGLRAIQLELLVPRTWSHPSKEFLKATPCDLEIHEKPLRRDLDLARGLIDANAYMTLATADADGRPWASPVWFAHHDYTRFYLEADAEQPGEAEQALAIEVCSRVIAAQRLPARAASSVRFATPSFA